MTIYKNQTDTIKKDNHYTENPTWIHSSLSYSVLKNSSQSKQNNISNIKIPDFPRNLEYILHSFLCDSSGDPINQIWEDKLKSAKLKISSMVYALTLREIIKRKNIFSIDEDICKIHTQQLALANSPSFNKYSLNTEQLGLEKTVTSLEHEKRSEIVNCWKDMLLIQKDFIEAINEYLSLKRKMEVLEIDTRRYSND